MKRCIIKVLRILLVSSIFISLCLIAPVANDTIYLNFNSREIQYTAVIDCPFINVYHSNKLISKYAISSAGDKVLSSFVSDLDNDRSDEILLLLKHRGEDYGSDLIILSYDGGFTMVFTKPVEGLNPWKVQACDIDGDGDPEISLGVYTLSAYHKDLSKRPFIYTLTQNDLYPKWLGSRLSKPFDDYIFSDVDSDNMDELISIEILRDGSKEITSYKWTGFGFQGIGNSYAFDGITGMKPYAGGISALVYENNKWAQKYFKLIDDKFIEWE